MSSFKIVPEIHVMDTLREFLDTFSVGKGDILLTDRCLYDPYLADKNLECTAVSYTHLDVYKRQLIGWAILVLFGGSVTTTFGIIFICVFAVVLGSLTIVYRRAFLIFSTSFNGASSLALYGGYFFLHLSSIFSAQAGTASQTLRSLSRAVTAFQQTHAQWLLLATLVLAILGILIQFTKTAPRKKSK